MTDKLNFEIDVRIPSVLIQQMMDGEITCAMLVTMNILYKWANWNTGRVRWVSAGGLRTASRKAYSERTFQDSLKKLEEMGWITRLMTRGSHDDYPVILHNYKVTDDAGKVHILNPKDIKVYDPFATGACGEGSDEASDETSDEGSDEASDKDKHNTKHNTEPDTKHGTKPKEVLSVFQSVSLEADASGSQNQNQDKPSLGSRSITEEQKQNQPQEQPQIDALTDEVGGTSQIAATLGLSYFSTDHAETLARIAKVLYRRNRSVHWLTSLVSWAKGIGFAKDRESQFWGRRLQTGDTAVAKLAEFLENGKIAEQFDIKVVAEHGSDAFSALRENDWLHRTFQQEEEKEDTIFGSPIPANMCPFHRKEVVAASRLDNEVAASAVRNVIKASYECSKCNPEPEMDSVEEMMAKNKAKAAADGDDLAWFKQHGKVGDWSISSQQWKAMGFTQEHVKAVIRSLRSEGLAITKEVFIEMLGEEAEPKAMAAAGEEAEEAILVPRHAGTLG